ncbi:hypothetical protein [Actinomyces faecalis]|uniref:hypothetical protein n=1 Tax=Actinomyces faecalis TaxID=2722820 RepID=UPI001554F2AB|nr:hypothetical protein [Actinomyces faecalis]
MTAPGSFDPFSAPAPEDLPARATRLATACAVISMLMANPPSPVLRENLHEGAMTERWPLRDAASRAGAEELALAAHESPQAQETDWRELIGPSCPTRPVLSDLVPEAPAVPAEAEATLPSPSHLSLLPHDHLAVGLSRTGSLAVRAVGARQVRSEGAAAPDAVASDTNLQTTAPAPSPEETAFVATVTYLLAPLAPATSQVLRSQATTHLYRGAADLLDGIVAEAESLAEAVQAGATRR